MRIEKLRNKKILILGFGREGRDNLKFLRKLFPKKVIGIADQKQFSISKEGARLRREGGGSGVVQFPNVKFHLGKNYLKALKNYDVIIKSPGIPFKILPKSALNKVTTQTEIFFDNCPGKIIGVTGTKGKSTTASLIYQILKACPERSRRAHLVGNIGKPVLSLLFRAKPNDIYVYELSSHQLYNLKKSPRIAVFLNIYPEHLDYYRNFKEYVRAKANITRYQTKDDYLIFNSGDKLVKEIAKKSKAKKIPIKGEYYDLNRKAGRAVGKIFKIPSKIIEKAIREFKPLPHRLELVGTFKGITFYNDALSTIPETAILAMKALGKRVQTVFLGGFDRKIDFKKLAKFIIKNKNIRNIIFFPTTGEKIWKEILRQANLSGVRHSWRPFFVDNMRDGVKLAYKHTEKGKICLLSCASTSFSIFRDYKEKGNLFKKYVKKYGKA